MKTSIIMTAYNQTRFQTHMTMAAIANITKFTNPDEYELILVEGDPKFPIRDDYKVLKIDQHVTNEPDIGYTASMNQGAAKASGDYLVFIQNDVFVHEHWLSGLLHYLGAGYDVVFPDQVPRSRQYVLDTFDRSYNDAESKKGGRDAGLLAITREAFEKTGGWNEDLSLLAERDFYERMGRAGLKWTDTNKVIITHIMAATNLYQLDNDPEEYARRMDNDAKKLN